MGIKLPKIMSELSEKMLFDEYGCAVNLGSLYSPPRRSCTNQPNLHLKGSRCRRDEGVSSTVAKSR